MSLGFLPVAASLWSVLTGSPVCSSKSTIPASIADVPPFAVTRTAFVDVNVIPMDTERVLAHQTVLVNGGRITAVGPTNEVQVPAGAVRIDGRGRYLMPGLTDLHTHFLLSHGIDWTPTINAETYNQFHLLGFLASGITAIRATDPGFPDIVRESRRTDITEPMPSIYVGDDLRQFMFRSLQENPSLNQDSILPRFKAAGYNFILDNWRSDSFRTVARQLGIPLTAHVHSNFLFEKMLALGSGAAVDHLYQLWGPLGDTVTISGSKLRIKAEETQRAGVWVIPTLACMIGQRRGRNIPRDPTMREIVKALHDAGVGLLAAGDDGATVHDDLAAFVRSGLTSYEALVTATRNPAQFLGLAEELGTVEVGKRADLILLYGNPLADIRHTREPAGVMRGGQWFARAELDQRLLTAPKDWFFLSVTGEFTPGTPDVVVHGDVKTHRQTFERLIDSLEMAKGSGRKAYEGMLQRLARTFGAMRPLVAEEREGFDAFVRVWIREQTRLGYGVSVPGVAPVP